MSALTVERLAHEKGYRFCGTVKASDPGSGVKLQKGDRNVVVDQELLDDIAALSTPIENPDANSPIKAVG